MNLIFFGTSYFAAEVLSFFLEKSYPIAAIVTKPDRKKGRSQKSQPTPVKVVADSYNLPCYQPEKASTESFVEELSGYDPDLFLVIAYGEIIKPNLLALPKRGSINVHASLLPKYRGAAPIRRALLNGEEKSGITIIEMTAEMDAGDMLGKEEIFIPETMNFTELESEMIQATKKILPQVIEEIEKGVVRKTPQNHSHATFAKKIKKEETRIYWDRVAFQIHNQIRAFSRKPGAFTEVEINQERKRLKILRSEVKPLSSKKPGEILAYNNQEFIVGCKEAALSILEVQLEGKKAMPFDQFVRGFPNISHNLY